MTDTVVEAADPTTGGRATRQASTGRNRILLIASAAATVVPFFWAAIRDARNGFYPTLDVAATVVRGRATFSANPPLLGMWSSGSSWAGHEIHFPGPTLLHLLAGPTHLFGNTWGPLLTMAILNSFWVLLAGWLVYRLVGVDAALVAFAFLNAFLWSIGSENLIDPRPMEMVTIPFLCFLLLVWLVASGEIDALPGLAIVANFLFLNHLVMALQIPVITMCAVVGVIVWIRRRRLAGRPTAGDTEPPPDEPGPRPTASDEPPVDPLPTGAGDPDTTGLRPLRRRLLQAAAITIVLWLPSLIQQATNRPGNLTLLLKASSQHREPVGSLLVGYTATLRLIVKPSFWFRGRFDNHDFPQGLQTVTAWDIVGTLLLAAAIIGTGLLAWRRRDRLVLGALSVAVVGIGVSIVTVSQAPGSLGFPMQYLRSLWGLAAFVWFAVAFAAWRALTPHLRMPTASVAGVAAIVFGVLGLSYANFGAATDMTRGPFAEKLVDELVPKLRDQGPINVYGSLDFASQRYFSSVLLGLDTAGIHYCVDSHFAEQFGSVHDCLDPANRSILVQSPYPSDIEGATVLLEVKLLTDEEARELAETRRVFEDWIATDPDIVLTAQAQKFVDAAGPDYRKRVYEAIRPDDGDLHGLLDSDTFRLIIGYEENHRNDPANNPRILTDPDIPVEAISRYFQLTDLTTHGSVRVYDLPEGFDVRG